MRNVPCFPFDFVEGAGRHVVCGTLRRPEIHPAVAAKAAVVVRHAGEEVERFPRPRPRAPPTVPAVGERSRGLKVAPRPKIADLQVVEQTKKFRAGSGIVSQGEPCKDG